MFKPEPGSLNKSCGDVQGFGSLRVWLFWGACYGLGLGMAVVGSRFRVFAVLRL